MHNLPLILIVDNEKDFLDIMTTKLEAAGFATASAQGGDECLKKTRELNPDLILLDVVMPKVDGITTINNLKGDQELKNIKVVLLSSFASSEPDQYQKERERAIKAGAIDFFVKTDDLNKIAEKIKELFQIKQITWLLRTCFAEINGKNCS